MSALRPKPVLTPARTLYLDGSDLGKCHEQLRPDLDIYLSERRRGRRQFLEKFALPIENLNSEGRTSRAKAINNDKCTLDSDRFDKFPPLIPRDYGKCYWGT